ncbi:MAG: DUF4031 domain-containing protein [Ktedonobacterales bacterium]|nr:DUF4031 domain-containing protein [Ktedonobacterales bacterium]
MAILVHPARATRDWLPAGVGRGERMYHVLSDIIGPHGSQELRLFVARCGIQRRWVQFPGSYREHYDAPPHAAECLLRHGARLASNREIGTLLRAKRNADRGADR